MTFENIEEKQADDFKTDQQPKQIRKKRGPYKKKHKEVQEVVKQEPKKRGRKKTEDEMYIEMGEKKIQKLKDSL